MVSIIRSKRTINAVPHCEHVIYILNNFHYLMVPLRNVVSTFPFPPTPARFCAHQVVDTFADSRDRDILNLAEEMEQDLESDKQQLELKPATA